MFIRGKFVASDSEITAALKSFNYSKPVTDLRIDDFRDWCWLNFVQMHNESEIYAAVYKCLQSGYIGQ